MSSSDSNTENLLWNLVDNLIEQTNVACEEGLNPGDAHQALMYACARFGAFIVADNSESKADFIEDEKDAKKFYLDQFRSFLHENFDEYRENFKHYVGDKDASES